MDHKRLLEMIEDLKSYKDDWLSLEDTVKRIEEYVKLEVSEALELWKDLG